MTDPGVWSKLCFYVEMSQRHNNVKIGCLTLLNCSLDIWIDVGCVWVWKWVCVRFFSFPRHTSHLSLVSDFFLFLAKVSAKDLQKWVLKFCVSNFARTDKRYPLAPLPPSDPLLPFNKRRDGLAACIFYFFDLFLQLWLYLTFNTNTIFISLNLKYLSTCELFFFLLGF